LTVVLRSGSEVRPLTARTIGADRVVAYNLRKARELRGWKQEQAAVELEPFLGELWSKSVWSSAESSYRSDRVRRFEAREIEAFARCFDLPVSWFFLPPVDDDPDVRVGDNAAKVGALNAGEQLDLAIAYADPKPFGDLIARVDAIAKATPRRYRTPPQVEYGRRMGQLGFALIQEGLGDLSAQATSLRETADLLDRVREEVLPTKGIGSTSTSNTTRGKTAKRGKNSWRRVGS
jgi:hypothetical protein